ncbi:MAG: NUDIX hydrolase [Patescibacteria group bacterium]
MIFIQKPDNFNPQFEVVSCFCEFKGNSPEQGQTKFLLLHRQDHKAQGDTWGLPAGKINPDENIYDAMLRELKEETGIILAKNELNYSQEIYVRYPKYDFTYHIFTTEFQTQPEIQTNPEEHKDFRWATVQEALKMPLVLDLDNCIKLFFKL